MIGAFIIQWLIIRCFYSAFLLYLSPQSALYNLPHSPVTHIDTSTLFSYVLSIKHSHTHSNSDGCTGEQLDVQYRAWGYFDMKTGIASRNWTINVLGECERSTVKSQAKLKCTELSSLAIFEFSGLPFIHAVYNMLYDIFRWLFGRSRRMGVGGVCYFFLPPPQKNWFMKSLPCICLCKIWGNEHTEQVWGRDNLA